MRLRWCFKSLAPHRVSPRPGKSPLFLAISSGGNPPQGMSPRPRGSQSQANTVRVFEDGNFVLAHTEYNFFGPKVGFDIYRFEDGKIVEHWDNLQETPAKPSPSGHTMTDGPTMASDLDKTEANKALMANLHG